MAFPTDSATYQIRMAFGADLTTDPGTWPFVDVTTDLDLTGDITIKEGRSEGSTQAEASSIQITFKATGETAGYTTPYMPEDPRSPYWPNVTEGTPVQLFQNTGYDDYELFTGYVTSITPEWPGRSKYGVRIRMEARGILAQLGRGAKPLKSPLYRAILATNPVAYWPMTDGKDATSMASAVNGPAMTYIAETERPALAATTGPDGATESLPDLLSDTDTYGLQFTAPVTTGTTGWSVGFHFRAALDSEHDDFGSFELAVVDVIGGTLGRLIIGGTFLIDNPSDYSLRVKVRRASDIDNAIFGPPIAAPNVVDGAWHYAQVALTQTGAGTAQLEAYIDGTRVINSSLDAIFGTTTIGRITTVHVGQDTAEPEPFFRGSTGGIEQINVGHVAVYDSSAEQDLTVPGRGYEGEQAGDRFARLCSEESVRFQVVGGGVYGDLDLSTEPMGAQRSDTFLSLVRDCEAADGGRLSEASFGLRYRPRVSLYNQEPALTIDCAARELASPFQPTKDLERTRNEWEISRPDGSSATARDEEHQRTRGVLDDSASINAAEDWQLIHQAGWRVHLGTTPGMRYPSASVNLHRHTNLIPKWQQLRLGDRVQVMNLLPQHPPEPVDQIIEGRTQTIKDRRFWKGTLTLSPARPWEVERIDTSGSELAAAITSSDGTLQTITTSGPIWSPNADDWPIRLDIGGECATATSVTSATVSFADVGAGASATTGSLTPALPGVWAPGYLLLLFASIRNSGAGTVNTPTGWTPLASFGNAALFGRVAQAGDTAPTVAFTGGVANATTLAQVASFVGFVPTVAHSTSQLNGSGQDIATPALTVSEAHCLVLTLGWKQDDWTSVALPFGVTQIGAVSSTSGDDAAMVWGYTLQDRAASTIAGTLAVTGGAAAISRSAVVALNGGLQTMAVTRSVNGVVAAHAAGTPVRLWHPAALAL